MSAEGYTVLIVEQNIRQVLKVADRAYLLETGRIKSSGASGELLESDEIKRAYLEFEMIGTIEQEKGEGRRGKGNDLPHPHPDPLPGRGGSLVPSPFDKGEGQGGGVRPSPFPLHKVLTVQIFDVFLLEAIINGILFGGVAWLCSRSG